MPVNPSSGVYTRLPIASVLSVPFVGCWVTDTVSGSPSASKSLASSVFGSIVSGVSTSVPKLS